MLLPERNAQDHVRPADIESSNLLDLRTSGHEPAMTTSAMSALRCSFANTRTIAGLPAVVKEAGGSSRRIYGPREGDEATPFQENLISSHGGMFMLTIELRSIGDIRPYPNNPRTNDNAVDAVAASIREYGWRQPIVVDSDGVIICGQTRYKAAQKLGMDQVPSACCDRSFAGEDPSIPNR